MNRVDEQCEVQSAFLYSCSIDANEPIISHVTSCEAPSSVVSQSVRSQIHEHARSEFATRNPNHASSGEITCDYIQPIALSEATSNGEDETWINKRMASDCGPDFNPNQALMINHFECRYVGKGTLPDGRVVSNPHKVWKGRLASCHASDGLAVSDQLMRDVQKYAYHAAAGDEAKLDVSQFVCDIVTVPTM